MSKTKLPKTLTTVTPFSKLLAVFIIFAFILAGVYAGMLYQHMVDITAFSSLFTSQITQQTNEVKRITLQDNGKTIPVKVGNIISFELGNVTQRWTLTISSSLLKRITLGIAERAGQEGRYLVTGEGIIVVNATGVALCPSGSMCPMYATHFTVTLDATK